MILPSQEGIIILTPKTIKTLCWIISLTILFLIAIVHFSPKAHGYSPPLLAYTYQLDLVEKPTYSVGDSGFVTAQYVPTIATRPTKASNPYIEELIRSSAIQHGVDPDLAVRIATAESGLVQKWNYMNPTGDPNSKWSAYGVFQVIASHEKKYGISRMTLEGNIEIAMRLLQKGTSDWKLSEKNWNP